MFHTTKNVHNQRLTLAIAYRNWRNISFDSVWATKHNEHTRHNQEHQWLFTTDAPYEHIDAFGRDPENANDHLSYANFLLNFKGNVEFPNSGCKSQAGQEDSEFSGAAKLDSVFLVF